jgi:hypothetical protein
MKAYRNISGAFLLLLHMYFQFVSSNFRCCLITNVSKGVPQHTYGGARCIVPDYRLDDRGSIPGRIIWFFLQLLCPDQLWGPPSLLSNGYWESFLGGKARPGRDADHTHHLVPSSKMSRSYSSSPLYAYMAVAGRLYFAFNIIQYNATWRHQLQRNVTIIMYSITPLYFKSINEKGNHQGGQPSHQICHTT